MSTLAAIVALGGVSYAATAVASRQASRSVALPTHSCGPSGPGTLCAPEVETRLASVTITLKHAAKVLLLGSGDVSYAGANGDTAAAEIQLFIDERSGRSESTVSNQQRALAGGKFVRVSVSYVVSLPAGHRAFSLSGSTNASSGVSVRNAQLVALRLR
jgi:hypothetical protein